MSNKTDTITIEKILIDAGYICSSISKNILQVKTSISRMDAVFNILETLKEFDARYDINAKGSSIGAVIAGKVKILIKAIITSNVLAAENIAISQLNATLTLNENTNIKCGNKIYHDIVKCISTPGTPKSDFHFINQKGEEVFWISHKKGKTTRDFQQWGGITEKEIQCKFSYIFQTAETIIKLDLENQNLNPDILPNGMSYIFKNLPDELKMMSVYGVEYNKDFSRQNVNVLLQGNVSLTQMGSYYHLDSDGHVHYNGEEMHEEFEPCLAVIYKGDRSQLNLRGARATISPGGGRNYKREFTL